jgi:hypothetical protein
MKFLQGISGLYCRLYWFALQQNQNFHKIPNKMLIIFIENDCRCTKPKQTQGKDVQRDITLFRYEFMGL